jgi:hypothetical protein
LPQKLVPAPKKKRRFLRDLFRRKKKDTPAPNTPAPPTPATPVLKPGSHITKSYLTGSNINKYQTPAGLLPVGALNPEPSEGGSIERLDRKVPLASPAVQLPTPDENTRDAARSAALAEPRRREVGSPKTSERSVNAKKEASDSAPDISTPASSGISPSASMSVTRYPSPRQISAGKPPLSPASRRARSPFAQQRRGAKPSALSPSRSLDSITSVGKWEPQDVGGASVEELTSAPRAVTAGALTAGALTAGASAGAVLTAGITGPKREQAKEAAPIGGELSMVNMGATETGGGAVNVGATETGGGAVNVGATETGGGAANVGAAETAGISAEQQKAGSFVGGPVHLQAQQSPEDSGMLQHAWEIYFSNLGALLLSPKQQSPLVPTIFR